MRKYKQVKRKEVIFSMDEWKAVESRAASTAKVLRIIFLRLFLSNGFCTCKLPRS